MDQSLLKKIEVLRESHPNMEDIFMNGSCLNMYLLIKCDYPDAEPWFDINHVITKVGDTFYDIRGVVEDTSNYIPLSEVYDSPGVIRSYKNMLNNFHELPVCSVPIDQTGFGEEANSMASCLATFFNIPVSVVFDPEEEYRQGGDWLSGMVAWVNSMGWELVTQVGYSLQIPYGCNEHYLVMGPRWSTNEPHMCIYKNGELWHDPHPDKMGIERVITKWFLSKL